MPHTPSLLSRIKRTPSNNSTNMYLIILLLLTDAILNAGLGRNQVWWYLLTPGGACTHTHISCSYICAHTYVLFYTCFCISSFIQLMLCFAFYSLIIQQLIHFWPFVYFDFCAGMSEADPESATWLPQLQNIWASSSTVMGDDVINGKQLKDNENVVTSIVLQLSMPNETITKYGAPAEIYIEYTFDTEDAGTYFVFYLTMIQILVYIDACTRFLCARERTPSGHAHTCTCPKNTLAQTANSYHAQTHPPEPMCNDRGDITHPIHLCKWTHTCTRFAYTHF